jgi:hypothetical protein
VIQIPLVPEPRARNEQQHEHNHKPLLGSRENKQVEEPFH